MSEINQEFCWSCLAKASLGVGLVSVFIPTQYFFAPIFTYICGLTALAKGDDTVKRMAITGLILGFIGLVRQLYS